MNWKYYLGALASLPFLPLLYIQGKRIREKVPKLPEAKGPRGVAGKGKAKTIRLLTIGESTIAGVGVGTHANGFTGSLAEALSSRLSASVDWRVYARSGYTAARVRRNLLPKIEEESCDLLVVGLGGNDAFKLQRPEVWKRDVHQLIDDLRVKFPVTPIFFLNMPPIKEFPAFTPLIKATVGNLVELLGQELEEVVAKWEGVFYYAETITLREWQKRWAVAGDREDFFSDGVHPAPITYQVWGRDMAIFIGDRLGD